MSNYEYGRVVQDFARRTLRNLEYIETHAKSGEVFEATQLINSMLGLLIFPQQEFYDRIPETPLVELEKQGWPRISASGELPDLPDDAGNLKGLLRYLRNSIAHFNTSFLADENNRLHGIRVWNHVDGKRQNPKNWEAEISLDELRSLTRKFAGLILRMPPRRLGKANPFFLQEKRADDI
jgi:hypothetical protein